MGGNFLTYIALVIAPSLPLSKQAAGLKSTSEKTKIASLAALQEAGPAAAPHLRAVCDCLLDKSNKVAVAAIEAIEQIDPMLYKPLREYLFAQAGQRILALKTLMDLEDRAKPIVGVLITQLKNETDTQQALALIEALRKMKVTEKPLIDLMKKGSVASSAPGSVRIAALDYLVEWAGAVPERRKDVVEILGDGLSYGGTDLMVRCLEVAGDYGAGAKDLLPLIKKLKLADSADVRAAATEAAKRIEKK
jgi:hypothetical protein